MARTLLVRGVFTFLALGLVGLTGCRSWDRKSDCGDGGCGGSCCRGVAPEAPPYPGTTDQPDAS